MHIFDQLKIPKPDFSRKSEFGDRVAIIALRVEHNISHRILGEVFGLSRTTVAKICSFTGEEYKDEKREFKRLGPFGSYRAYVTQRILDKLDEVMKK